jgi:hypothetical protein
VSGAINLARAASFESFEAKRRAAVAWLPTARRAQNDSA